MDVHLLHSEGVALPLELKDGPTCSTSDFVGRFHLADVAHNSAYSGGNTFLQMRGCLEVSPKRDKKNQVPWPQGCPLRGGDEGEPPTSSLVDPILSNGSESDCSV